MLLLRKLAAVYLLVFMVISQKVKYTITVEEEMNTVLPFPSTSIVTVLTREEIEKLPFRTLGELLNFLAPIMVLERSRVSFDVGLRGGAPGQAAILLNGIRVNDPQTHHFNLELPVSLDQVERIEIIRGGTSALFGAATSGAINIVLKKPLKHIRLETGEKGLLGLSAAFPTGNFNIYSMALRSDGYYRGREFSKGIISLTYRKESLSLFLSAGDKKMGEDNFYAPYPSWEGIKTLIFSSNMKKNHLQLNFLSRVLKDHFILDRENPDWYENFHTNYLNVIRATGEWKGKWGRTALGAELGYESIKSNRLGNHSRVRGGVFSSLTKIGRDYSLDLGFRLEKISGYAPFVFFYAGYQRSLGKKAFIGLSLGNSLRVGDFTELYYSSPVNKGNPFLKPEKSFQAEIFIEKAMAGGKFNLGLFHERIEDLIDWVRKEGNIWVASNIPEFNTLGVEGSFSLRKKSLFLSLGFLRLFSLSTLPHSCKYALSREREKYSASLGISGGKTSMSLSFSYRVLWGKQRGLFLNAKISLRLDQGLWFFIKAHNLLNTVIEEIPGIKTEGRWISAGFLVR